MKKSELFFNAILVPFDFLMITLAAILAYFIRISEIISAIRPVLFNLTLIEYLRPVIVVALFCVGFFALLGLYKMEVNRRFSDESVKIFVGTSAGLMAIVIFIFLKGQFFNSRFLIIASWILGVFLVILGRLIVRYVQLQVLQYGYGVRRVVIIGDNEVANKLKSWFESKKEPGYKVVDNIKEADNNNLKMLLERHIDEIIQCDPDLPNGQNAELIEFCDVNKIDYKFIPNLFETMATNINISTIQGVPLIELQRTPLEGWWRIFKRIVDILGAFFGIVLLFPFFMIIGVIIKLGSRGPILVKLLRVGYQGEFKIYKFRSMITGADKLKKRLMPLNIRKDGPLFKIKNDPRVTKIGRFIRKYRVDEFPQLINVLRGEMSLVGPRPHEPGEVAKYKTHHFKVLAVKPGMTGLAQISGSSDLKFEDEIRLDTYYVENWSLRLDLVVLLKTFKFILTDRSGC